jgi:predicted ATPase
MYFCDRIQSIIMSKYTFSIQDYHAIKDAKIGIDGITVLAGINGSGKSTLSRWLYYLINVMHGFERMQKSNFIDSLTDEISKVIRLFRINNLSSRYESYRDRIQQLKKGDSFEKSLVGDAFAAFTLQSEKDLKGYIDTATAMEKRRLVSYLVDDRSSMGYDPDSAVSFFISHCNDIYQEGLSSLEKKLSQRFLSDLEDTIREEYGLYDNMPSHVSLTEDGLSLIDHGGFIPPLMLNRAIYIDSPMVLSDDFYGGTLWGEFRKLLIVPNVKTSNEKLISSIRRTIGGEVKMEEDDMGFSQELHFVANSGVDIRIEDAATGIKSFAYVSRLLENGWIDKQTLLMIDEPEAHLHPQWVVEFARLLVLIHKELGTKIMIASHNPDMVAAIQSIACKEKVIDRTTFYLAEKEKGSTLYRFVNKGQEIGDIFESFNIAISRIEEYGTSLL